MKKQINPTVKAYLIRSAFYLLLLVAVCAIPFALAQSRSRGTAKQSTHVQKAPAGVEVSKPVVDLSQSQPVAPAPVEDPWHGSPVVRAVPDTFCPARTACPDSNMRSWFRDHFSPPSTR